MTRVPLRCAALIALALLGAPPARAGAQTTDGLMAPAGHFRLEVAPTWHLWDRRFGLREEDGTVIEESEPLGFDLERASFLPLESLRTSLRNALADPTLEVSLGSFRAQVARERTAVCLGAALGVVDWLTVGVNVPVVETRTEIAIDLRALDVGNLGFAPVAADVSVFRAGLQSSAAALAARQATECPSGPGCTALTSLVARYTSFAQTLDRAYDGPVFLATGTPAGTALAQRMEAFRAEAAGSAPGVGMPGAPPLADAPLTEAQLVGLLTGNPGGPQSVAPLQTTRAPFQIGDVELTGAIRILEGAVRDSAGGRARLRYRLGGVALVRLPTGLTDDPDVPFDLGAGDGQMDVEVGAFADLDVGRFSVQAEGRRGLPQATTLVRRVAPPEDVLPFAETRREVRWTPGAWTLLEIAPRWRLTDEFALGALVRTLSKDADAYEEVVAPPPGLAPAEALGRETAMTLTEVGGGLAYSTVNSWREGRARLPIEMRLAVRRAISGSGGATPDGLRLEAGGQVFVRLWGAGARARR